MFKEIKTLGVPLMTWKKYEKNKSKLIVISKI